MVWSAPGAFYHWTFQAICQPNAPPNVCPCHTMGSGSCSGETPGGSGNVWPHAAPAPKPTGGTAGGAPGTSAGVTVVLPPAPAPPGPPAQTCCCSALTTAPLTPAAVSALSALTARPYPPGTCPNAITGVVFQVRHKIPEIFLSSLSQCGCRMHWSLQRVQTEELRATAVYVSGVRICNWVVLDDALLLAHLINLLNQPVLLLLECRFLLQDAR